MRLAIGDKVYFNGDTQTNSSNYGIVTGFLVLTNEVLPEVKYEGESVSFPTDPKFLELYEENLSPSNEQTVMFWNLQLQFMERSFESLKDVYKGLRYGSMYVQNSHTGKMDRLLHQNVCSEEDRLCLATHLALQLSGIKE